MAQILDSWISTADLVASTHSHAASAGSNRVGVLMFTHEQQGGGGLTISTTVTWGGQDVTEVKDFFTGGVGGYHDLLWVGILDEAGIDAMSGSDVVVVFDNDDVSGPPDGTGPFGNAKAQSAFYEDVDQGSLPTPNVDNDTGTGTASAIVIARSGTLNVIADAKVVVCAVSGQGTTADEITAATGYTIRASVIGATNDHSCFAFDRDAVTSDATHNPSFPCASANRLGIVAIALENAAAGTSAIDASPALVFTVPTADLEGGGKLDATPDLAFALPTVDLEAKGKLDAPPDLTFTVPTADLTAKGKLDATPDLVFVLASADLKALGKLDAPPAMVFTVPAADLKALGKLDAPPAMIFAVPSADLINATGVGPIDASPALTFSLASADLEARGKLDAAPGLVFTIPIADLKGQGKLDATPDLVFAAASADLKGTGKLDAPPAMLFGLPSVDLKARGKLDGTPDLTFTGTADLGGLGKLDAPPSMVFAVPSADLIDATPPSGFPYHVIAQQRRDMRTLITL